jgi:FkbM family methyltransferase
MIQLIKHIIFGVFVCIDRRLKFPNLKRGETAIQIGFDMSAPVTTDLFMMHQCVAPGGLVLGIDPMPSNHELAQQVINRKKMNIWLYRYATYSKPDTTTLLVAAKPSWNQLNNIPPDSSVDFCRPSVKVNMETVDHIIEKAGINSADISHINITNNGAEYATLLGMEKFLQDCKNLMITVVCGRYDETGTIDGRPDHELITELLARYGFKTKFRRIHQLFWWGFCTKLVLNRKWIYGKKNYGVLFAGKGEKKIRWWQSFS